MSEKPIIYTMCMQNEMSPLIITNQQGQVCKGWTLISKLNLALGIFQEKLKNFIVLHHCGQSMWLTSKHASGSLSSQSPALINPTVTLLLNTFVYTEKSSGYLKSEDFYMSVW